MAKSDPDAANKQRKKTIRWVVTIFFVTIFISGAISFLSDIVMSGSGIVVAFIILTVIVLIGILFDVVGVAVTSADEKPFHSMASRKVSGAQEAIKLLRHAEQVSSICNDVVGDICGVISGSAAATIAARVLAVGSFSWEKLLPLTMSALVAGFTVGGKAIGKTFAVNSSTGIVFFVGRVLYAFHHIPSLFKKKK